MKKTTILLLSCLVAAGAFSYYFLCSGIRLFHNGKSAYTIVLSEGASESEKTAAKELQQYVEQTGKVLLPISNDLEVKGRKIFVGFNDKVAAITGEKAPDADFEGFTCRTAGKDILIYGGSQRGTMYGVFDFLEKHLGVKWLTTSFTSVPSLKSLRLKSMDYSDRPFLRYRYSNYAVAGDPVWKAHNRENMDWGAISNGYGNLEGYWSAHTMGVFVPVEEFFHSHPEYFCLRDGKRYDGYGQLCLSNPEVLEICKTRLEKVMREQPLYRVYSLSQNDNQKYCQCEKCKALEDRYGGHSGILLWFVNQVADAVREEFPDKFVGTFAYQYTRKPPVGIIPRDNVVIRLCSIECCFAHPLEDVNCPENRKFMEDIRKWSEIAPHLFIWDYIVDYAQFPAPWPNFQVLGPNIRTFGENKALGVFEEAHYQSAGGEFDEMKAWVVDKLLWNPDLDVDALVREFIFSYYGKSAPKVMEYYQLCKSLVKPDVHMGIFIDDKHEIYNDGFIHSAFDILGQAKDLAENDEIRERVERVTMQPLYLYYMRNKEKARSDGRWDELVTLMNRYQARPRESQSLEAFIAEQLND